MKEFNELVVIFLQVEHLFMCLRCPQLILRVQIKKIWYLKSILLSLEIIFTCWKRVLLVKKKQFYDSQIKFASYELLFYEFRKLT